MLLMYKLGFEMFLTITLLCAKIASVQVSKIKYKAVLWKVNDST